MIWREGGRGTTEAEQKKKKRKKGRKNVDWKERPCFLASAAVGIDR